MKAVRHLLDGAQPLERETLLSDLRRVEKVVTSSDGSWVTLQLQGYQRPDDASRMTLGLEGTLRDRDGTEITVVLHADSAGHLWELELIKWGDEGVVDPQWGTLSTC